MKILMAIILLVTLSGCNSGAQENVGNFFDKHFGNHPGTLIEQPKERK